MKYWRHVPPLRSMLAVEATARLGSFSKAAEELNVTQSAVSHLVGQAEEFLNSRLFERSSRPVRLTEDGRRYVAALAAGLNIIQAEGEYLQKARNTNTITVSCNLAYANFWLLPRLKQFHEAHPDITLNMVTAYQGLPALSGDIDLSIRFGQGVWADCHAELLIAESIVPVASPAYLERSPPCAEPADLLRHRLLHARADDKTWYDWSQWFHHHDVQFPTRLSGPWFDNHLLMMQAALASSGVALGWIGTAAEFVRLGQLVELFPERVQADGGVYLVRRADRKLTNAASTFAKWLISVSDVSYAH